MKKKVCSSSSLETSSVEVEFDDEGLNGYDIYADILIICGEYGKNVTVRCTLCGRWAHEDCIGVDNSKM